jgi:hypothetical protein
MTLYYTASISNGQTLRGSFKWHPADGLINARQYAYGLARKRAGSWEVTEVAVHQV